MDLGRAAPAPLQILVVAGPGCREAEARALARRLGLRWAGSSRPAERVELQLTGDGLLLSTPPPGGPVRADLLAAFDGRRVVGLRRQPLARALGLGARQRRRSGPRPLQVVDATAGLGRDAAAMARLGCTVVALERSALVAALLHDALERARGQGPVGVALAHRLTLEQADARSWLAQLPPTRRPDLVYLDPMYHLPGRKAAARKEMAALATLLGGDEDAAELLDVARSVARERVVVKRARHAPPLGGAPPTVSVPGRTLRFDVYLPPPSG